MVVCCRAHVHGCVIVLGLDLSASPIGGGHAATLHPPAVHVLQGVVTTTHTVIVGHVSQAGQVVLLLTGYGRKYGVVLVERRSPDRGTKCGIGICDSYGGNSCDRRRFLVEFY